MKQKTKNKKKTKKK